MEKKVTVIKPVCENRFAQMRRRLRVCGYARVSTKNMTQADSYTAQVAYYTEKIQSNPLWEFAGVFADRGITGTKAEGRDDFNAMIAACEDGDIDLILAKSVTRFARNTVECIQIIRKLKAIGVGICFEKENINTLEEKSELLLTVMASMAQGESEDFSGNNRWATEKRFREGRYTYGTPPYGYTKDAQGDLIPKDEEGEIVRWIFESYINGMGTYEIAQSMNDQGVPTIRKAKCWRDSVIKGILKNPVYEGDLLLQKTFTKNSFPFERKKNDGERKQYLITDNHMPTVTREEAQAVRDVMKYRREAVHLEGKDSQNRYLFSGRIICEECESHFRRQKIYIGMPYEKIIWTCHRHVEDKDSCQTKAVREDVLQQAFTAMWNKLYTNQGTVLEPLLKALNELAASQPDTEEIGQLDREISNLSGQSQILNQVMKKGYMDSALFMEKNNLLTYRLTECRRKKTLLARRQKRTKEIVRTEQLIGMIKREGYQREFKEELFDLAVKELPV